MQTISTLGSRFVAAASALALSLVIISGTVSAPSTPEAATTYLGVVA